MELYRTIVKSLKPPELKDVAWLDVNNNAYRLKFYRNGRWMDIYTDYHLNPHEYLLKSEAEMWYQPIGDYQPAGDYPTEAPQDDQIYGRSNGEWVILEVTEDAPANNTLFSRCNKSWVPTIGQPYRQDGNVAGEVFNNYTDNVASGTFSHAEGNAVYAIGQGSHAEGFTTVAYGDYSHTGGDNTLTYNRAETALGKYNLTAKAGDYEWNTNWETIFSIGIGDATQRRNAFEVLSDGKIYVHGLVTNVMTSYDGIPTSDTLSLQDVVNNSFSQVFNLTNQYNDFYQEYQTHLLSDVHQLEELPNVADYVGKIVQYIGETTEEYTKGYFYIATPIITVLYDTVTDDTLNATSGSVDGDEATINGYAYDSEVITNTGNNLIDLKWERIDVQPAVDLTEIESNIASLQEFQSTFLTDSIVAYSKQLVDDLWDKNFGIGNANTEEEALDIISNIISESSGNNQHDINYYLGAYTYYATYMGLQGYFAGLQAQETVDNLTVSQLEDDLWDTSLGIESGSSQEDYLEALATVINELYNDKNQHSINSFLWGYTYYGVLLASYGYETALELEEKVAELEEAVSSGGSSGSSGSVSGSMSVEGTTLIIS